MNGKKGGETVYLKFLFEALTVLFVCDQAAHLFEVACMVFYVAIQTNGSL